MRPGRNADAPNVAISREWGSQSTPRGLLMSAINKVGIWTASLAAMAVFAGGATLAATEAEIDSGVQATLEKFYAEHAGDRELVRKAAGVLVFPAVTKGGAGIAGEHGEGALLVDGVVVGHYKV